MSNIACKIYEEQIKTLLSLPNQEEAKNVLYQALINSYNQFENQNDYQFKNQNENTYISLSILSNSILRLLSKNIVWKEYSNNYGGKREGAGKPKPKPKKKETPPPTLEEVRTYAQSRNRPDLADKFWDFFNSTDWIDSNGKQVKNWKAKFYTWESHSEKPREQMPETWWRA